jgi:hypothetical protein
MQYYYEREGVAWSLYGYVRLYEAGIYVYRCLVGAGVVKVGVKA